MKYFNRKNNYSLFFIIFLTSFLIGVIFTLHVGKTTNLSLLKNDPILSNMLLPEQKKDLDLTKFWSVFHLIKQNNYETNTVDNEKLVDVNQLRLQQ